LVLGTTGAYTLDVFKDQIVFAMPSEEIEDREDVAVQADNEDNESPSRDDEDGAVISRQPTLSRTTTKEEITQTDDELAFVHNSLGRGKRPWTQYRRFIFVLGCFMGVILAWAFQSPDLQLEGLLDSVDMADFFDDLKAALPSALPMGLVREAKEIQAHSRQSAGTGAFSIGEQMVQDGFSSHYPVIMVRVLDSIIC